jgi:3-hydroxyacyl-CoA dehydrogenase
MSASYQVSDGIAVITLNNPSVNGLGHATRLGAFNAMHTAMQDGNVHAVVLTGAGETFSGGADIREFDTPKSSAEPSLRTLIATIENANKPVVAALNGLALGGGLELALGCHYRMALRTARIGLPEVKLGVLPATGGTQRLPRLVGVERALNLITHGTVLEAWELPQLFVELVDGDVLTHARALARKIATVRPLPRVRNIRIDYPHHQAFFQFAKSAVASATRNLPAPRKCVECVAAAVSLPFDEGLKLERESILALLQTTESKALRHVFFGERTAARIEGIDARVQPRDINQAAVIGGGTMGVGIAMTFANAGIPVTIIETSQAGVAKALANARKAYESSSAKGKLSVEDVEVRMSLIAGALEVQTVRDVDIVVEAVFEDMDAKRQVFELLDGVMMPGAILATNTSTLDVDRIASFTRRPGDVVGMHFFSPANVMRLVEVVRGARTTEETLVTVMQLARRLKKVGVVAGVCDGFIGNRMIQHYTKQAGFLLEEGCLPAQVDQAMESFGFAMGPFRMGDLSGNDIGWAARKRRALENPGYKSSRIPDLLCEMGRFGQKTAGGWYDYDAGGRTPRPSALVTEMILAYARDAGIARRKVTDQEIVDRLILSMVNEGAFILEERIAQRASDIDVAYTSGYGFPAYRGGPMFYADTVGLPNVLVRIAEFAAGPYGDLWTPAPLLARLAREGGSFN